jgi:hypothetical protein
LLSKVYKEFSKCNGTKINEDLNMDKRPKQIPHQRKYTDGKQEYEKMLGHMSSGNANKTTRHHYIPTEMTQIQSQITK